MSMKVTGLDSLLARFQAIINNVEGSIPIVRHHSGRIAGNMQRDAPVLTGYMRDNVRSVDTSQGARIESGAPYSIYVDRGTSTQPPNPFWTRNLHQGIPEMLADVRKNARK